MLSLSIFDLRGDDALTLTQMKQAETDGIIFETIHYRKDGSVFPVEVNFQGTTIGGKKVLLSIIRDITDRKRVEEKLHLSEERFSKSISCQSTCNIYFRVGKW